MLDGAGNSSAVASGTVTTIVSGLDNPRDLAFGPNRKLYVAEAGHGGNPADCVPGGAGGGMRCPGFTSGVSVINLTAGQAHRVITGFASISDAGGFRAVGIDGISFLGNGTAYGIETSARDEIEDGIWSPELTAGLRAELGRLIQFNPSGHARIVADVGHFDYLWTVEHQDLVPGQFPESNPYGVLAVGGTQWVADAASNTITRVRPNGRVSVESFVPNPPLSDAVPTCLDRGLDGALYVGQLTGVPNPPGSAAIWRFDPASGALTQWATGLSNITGCGFGADGTFYATEFSAVHNLPGAGPGEGAVVRVPPGSSSPIPVAEGLSFPGGLAAGSDGSLYVSDWSIAPSSTGLGSVVRITP
jgi:hypothetical protein